MSQAIAQSQKRVSWQEFAKDPSNVETFREAIRIMKSRNTADRKSAAYRTSWQYWAAIHGYLGKGAANGTVQQFIARAKTSGAWRLGDEKFFEGIEDLTPPDSIAKAVWDQCEHGTPNFFLWHRLYLMHFEQVLRAAAKSNTLRVPYWDYTDPMNTALPAEFRSPTYVNSQGQTVDNPLYEQRRDPSWVVPATKLDADSTDIDSALEATTFAAFQNDPVNISLSD